MLLRCIFRFERRVTSQRPVAALLTPRTGFVSGSVYMRFVIGTETGFSPSTVELQLYIYIYIYI